ncbi:PREDICTED: nuclear RNA export factor 1-like [Cyphomyrmex costatus]|uniref:nuclear RNA export factor 1-like n=1 Tax=Cyphomyrmex costatus TaxID=456900 RepID=UPI00085232FA|nr:PREDICTED: nuclear RNA export factor 1-like [Cyphomyrmex costatus]
MPKKSNKMWGNGRNNRGNEVDKSYFGHDDRVGRPHGRDGRPHGHIKHRVSFKTHTPNNLARNLTFVNLDDDIPMTSNNNSRQGGQSGPRRLPPLRESNWYRVSIPYGQKYERDFIINTLLNYIAPDVFVPIVYKTSATDASFYIDDYKTAVALQNCDYKITMSDGFKLQVKVKPGFPIYDIDDKLKERLKQAMVKRYVQDTNALNLSKFYLDPDLCSDYFCVLFHPVMMKTVLDIVAEHIPNLEALNLEGNKLQNIERLSILTKKFSKLKILYIGDNKIKDIQQLDAIKDLKLEELKLTGNPVCNKYKYRQNEYVSDVRRRFARLLRLDGTELPRPIVFDMMDEPAKIPSSQRMYVQDAKAKEIASQFLQQYFTIFDSENRQPLLDAYNEHAFFSMTMNTFNNNKLNGHYLENRNLLRVNDTIRRQKFLKQGRLPVVSFISEMPRTRHLLNTFTMDISLVTQTMMFITITGYFQQLNIKEEPIRYFNRTFIIVPEGEGYCIRNEQLHISQPSEVQLKELHQKLNQLNAQQTQSETETLSSTEVVKPIATEPDDELKKQMALTLSQQTNMNLEWSLKCLRETQWIYDNAFAAFQEFFKLGQIPSEAFAK